MPPFHEDDRVTVHHGDALDVLRTLPDCSVDSVVTDPPSGIAFMGKDWDTDKGGRDAWVAWLASVLAECRRILKPGGHALVWALPRTSGWTHRAIEDAGMDVRDCITHLFGSGFPKSLDVGKAIDKVAPRAEMFAAFAAHYAERRKALGLTHREICAAVGAHGEHNKGGASTNWEKGYGVPTREQWVKTAAILDMPHEMWEPLIARAEAERDVVLRRRVADRRADGTVIGLGHAGDAAITAPATEDAARWDGWGTALKPSSEMWYLARRPLAGTVAANVLTHGTGALNIAATRVATTDDLNGGAYSGEFRHQDRRVNTDTAPGAAQLSRLNRGIGEYQQPQGRWPSNVVLSHSPTCPEDVCEPSCPVAELDAQSGVSKSPDKPVAQGGSKANVKWFGDDNGDEPRGTFGVGYGDQGGASRFFPVFKYQAKAPTRERPKVDGIAHPTVKPVALMSWLVRLVTPPGGVVLDPFGGSGATAEAAILEGFRCITIEREAEYLPLIQARIQRQQPAVEPRPAAQQMSLLDDPAA